MLKRNKVKGEWLASLRAKLLANDLNFEPLSGELTMELPGFTWCVTPVIYVGAYFDLEPSKRVLRTLVCAQCVEYCIRVREPVRKPDESYYFDMGGELEFAFGSEPFTWNQVTGAVEPTMDAYTTQAASIVAGIVLSVTNLETYIQFLRVNPRMRRPGKYLWLYRLGVLEGRIDPDVIDRHTFVKPLMERDEAERKKRYEALGIEVEFN